ncbi:MAG: hypothetical protein KKG03_03660 [Gammaproteobacteria bacterium]|nr:hypothetical protein [Sideroxydans sp.]MBU4150728.1 hypothetical protein [Gammaproteobacteria bacterium]
MKYRDGFLLLDKEEVRLLSLTLMTDVEATYAASEFISGLHEVQAEAEKHIQEISLQETPERRRSLQVDILKQLISTCEKFKGRGYTAAQNAGCSIQLH